MKRIINGFIFFTFLTVGVSYAETNLRLIAQHKGHDHDGHSEESHEKEVKKSHKGHDHDDHSEESHKEEKRDEHEGHDHDEHTESSHSKKKVKDKHLGHEANDDSHDEHAHEGHDEDSEDEHDDHGSSKAIGEGKAIEEVDETKGFKLSKEATKTIKVKTSPIAGKTIEIPKGALVVSLNEKGIYRYRNGYYKFLKVAIKDESSNSYFIFSEDLNSGDKIATEGVGLLRVADIYSTDTAEYGHSH